MNLPCRAILMVLVLSAPWTAVRGETSTGFFQYDARMAFLNAGELSLELNRAGTAYEVAGEFQTSRAMSAYYTWNGIFAATGRWERQGPVTTAYMARTKGKDNDLKIVVNTEQSARLLASQDGEFEDIEKPAGIDLISALFFSPSCYRGGVVHDGEDTYKLDLRSEKTRKLKGSDDYFNGEVVNCDYAVRDHKGRKRRVIVSLADVGDTTVAVQVRAKIPVLPDAVFRLRMPPRVVTPPPANPQVVASGQ